MVDKFPGAAADHPCVVREKDFIDSDAADRVKGRPFDGHGPSRVRVNMPCLYGIMKDGFGDRDDRAWAELGVQAGGGWHSLCKGLILISLLR